MKKSYLLFAALSVVIVANPMNAENTAWTASALTDNSEHSNYSEGNTPAVPMNLSDYRLNLKEVTTSELKYSEPSKLFSMGYTFNNSYYGKTVRMGAAYMNQVWTNVSTGFGDNTVFEWSYDDPAGEGQGAKFLSSKDKDLTVNYPYNENGYWCAPVLTATTDGVSKKYEPEILYRFGGPSYINTEYGILDFGMTPYSTILYADPKGRRTTTFGTLKWAPTFTDPNSMTRWNAALPEGASDATLAGFYSIFHEPEAPYAITKIWGWIEYSASKAATLKMTLYKLDENRNPTDEVIAVGETSVKAGSAKSLLFNLRRPTDDPEGTIAPITIDCGFMAVLEGFNTQGDFTKLQPILGAGTVWTGSDVCPWPYNCGVLLKWKENDKETQGYFIDSKIYDETTGSSVKLGACDFLWMVDANYAWIFEKEDVTSVDLPGVGGDAEVTLNSYYPLYDKLITVAKDADWIDFTVTAAEETASDNVLKVSASATTTVREGHVTVTGPATNYTLTIKQAPSSGVKDESAVKTPVSSEYLDVTGRRINGEPEKGLFIRIDKYSDGSSKAVKIYR